MKIIIAIDSFKGSLSSMAAGEAAARAAREVFPAAEVRVFPLADGGEGTVDALTHGLGGEIVRLGVTGPLQKPVDSRFGLLPATHTAVIEMADAAGLPLVPAAERDPRRTTTYGLGELILAAMERGCHEFIIGIGGSATNDCGLGMLTALGAKFLNAEGAPVGITGGDLAAVRQIRLDGLHPTLRECRFHIACDVTNPLCGPNGCSAVYGPQKGATPAIVEEMDAAIKAFALLAEKESGISGAELPGAGAAGGLGFAFHAFLGGELKPGITLVLDVMNIKDALKGADLLLTGEGRMDAQTAMGKAPIGVARLAKAESPALKAIALCGCALPDAEAVNQSGIDAYFPILHLPMTVTEAMEEETALRNLEQTTKQALRLYRAACE